MNIQIDPPLSLPAPPTEPAAEIADALPLNPSVFPSSFLTSLPSASRFYPSLTSWLRPLLQAAGSDSLSLSLAPLFTLVPLSLPFQEVHTPASFLSPVLLSAAPVSLSQSQPLSRGSHPPLSQLVQRLS